MIEADPVLLLDSSAVSRGRLRDDLGAQYTIKIAQTLQIARARAESNPLLAAIVGVGEAQDDELAFLRWLSRNNVPTFAVLRNSNQERKLSGLGISEFCVAPNLREESELSAHSRRIGRWLGTIKPRTLASTHPRAPGSTSARPPSRVATVGRQSVPPEPATESFPAAYPAELAICIGVSTGGPEALETLLSKMPANAPPIVIVQHMPVGFTAALANRLHNASQLTVVEAKGGEALHPGCAWIAPGDRHLKLRRVGFNIVTELYDGPPVDRHRPSVNVLFESAARVLGQSAVGVIMTGMGDDGARGLLAMKQAGAITLGQDASSCTVFGMPQRAAALGAVDYQVSLADLAGRMLELAATRAHRRTS